MFLSEFSIKRPVVTIVVTLALMFMGWMALSNLRVNERPDVEMPMLFVNIPYPGASPETVEREVIDRIEKAMQSIPGVYELRATANEGNGQFQIIFNFDKNMIEAADEVRNAIASVRYKLPLEMREPVIQRFDMSAQPIVQIALTSTSQSHAELSRLAEEDLSEQLRAIPGVAVVNVRGALTRELSVLLHADKLREHNVSVTEVLAALRNQNMTAPVGKLTGPLEEQGIRLLGRVESPETFGQIVVKRRGDDLIRLSQVATVEDGFAELNSMSLRNGNPNVGIHVIRSRDASTVEVAKLVREKVEAMNKELLQGSTLTITQDGGEDAQQSLNNVIEALVLGAGLTILVVYAFLNSWRSTLITSLALPTSVLTAFIAVWLCGFTLNFMTLLGLSLAIGVLIDDAIVVRENIVRHMENGMDKFNAARVGTNEIGMAVTATTFSIIAVFVPVAFMDGVSGEWFRPFALTVAASVLVSLFISFSLDPMLSAYWGDPIDHHQKPKRGISRVLERFNHWFDHQADRYTKVIQWALKHRKAMTLIAVSSFVAAIWLQLSFGGMSFLPKSDFGWFAVDIRTPSGTSLEYARIKTEQAAQIARDIPEVRSTDSTVSPGSGRIYIYAGEKKERRRSIDDIAADLRIRLKSLVGAEYVVLDDINNGARKPVHIQFYGPDSRKLMEITNTFMAQLRQVPGAVDVGLSEQDPKPELQVELDRGLANSLGISINDAAQALRTAFAGVEVGDWVDPNGETRDVAVRLHPDDRDSAEDLERLPIVAGAGNTVIPLEQIAKITMGRGPSRIQHMDGKRMMAVTANVEGRSQGEVIQEAMKLARAIDFPHGYGIELGGAGRDQQEVFSRMMMALLAGVALMYLVLVIQFGSFLAPISVMLSLPLSLIGVVVSLLVADATINLMSLIGVIMLMGLVAKNAILLLDCARKKEQEGHDREEALMEAGRARLRPILMTTFALIAGMLPVAIGVGEGGEFYQPLAIAIIGGTITSTILTLLVVPTFYDSIEIASERALAKFQVRAERFGSGLSAVLIFIEAILTLVGIRALFRLLSRPFRRLPRGALVEDRG
ncbi:MAG: efflux RND transporter permease subunit [Permianibacter sp.]